MCTRLPTQLHRDNLDRKSRFRHAVGERYRSIQTRLRAAELLEILDVDLPIHSRLTQRLLP